MQVYWVYFFEVPWMSLLDFLQRKAYVFQTVMGKRKFSQDSLQSCEKLRTTHDSIKKDFILFFAFFCMVLLVSDTPLFSHSSLHCCFSSLSFACIHFYRTLLKLHISVRLRSELWSIHWTTLILFFVSHILDVFRICCMAQFQQLSVIAKCRTHVAAKHAQIITLHLHAWMAWSIGTYMVCLCFFLMWHCASVQITFF